jgi:hypothetical protein
MIANGDIYPVNDDQTAFVYYWGGTSKTEKLLRLAFPDNIVEKSVVAGGLRQLTINDVLTFTEEGSPFPSTQNLRLTKEQLQPLKDLATKYHLVSSGANALLYDLFAGGLAKNNGQPKPVLRSITGFLEACLVDLASDESTAGISLDEALDELQRRGLYREVVRAGDEEFDVTTALAKIAGVHHVKPTPELVEVADGIATKNSLLQSSQWKSARTDAEFDGMLGEFLTHAGIAQGQLMPQNAVDLVPGDEVMQLHSIHFIGDLYRDGEDEPYRTNTDVTSELDLMSVVRHEDGSFTPFALGNTKVAATNLAAAAGKQNDDAENALKAYVQQQRLPGKGTYAIVKRVYGFRIPSNDEVELRQLDLKSPPAKLTIGAKDAPGDYTRNLTLSYDEIHTLGILLRERTKM